MATLEELINRMYDMVQDAKGIPLAGEKCIVERDHMLDMLDELREALPNRSAAGTGNCCKAQRDAGIRQARG